MGARRVFAFALLALSATYAAAECEAEAAASAQCSRSLASVQSAQQASAAQAAHCQSALAAAQAEASAATAELASLRGSWLPPALGGLSSILGSHAGGFVSAVRERLQALTAALPSIQVPHVAALDGLLAQLGAVVGPLGAHLSLSEEQTLTVVSFFFTLMALLLTLVLRKPKTATKKAVKSAKAATPAAKAPAAPKAAPKAAAKSPIAAAEVASPRPKRSSRAL